MLQKHKIQTFNIVSGHFSAFYMNNVSLYYLYFPGNAHIPSLFGDLTRSIHNRHGVLSSAVSAK